MSFNIRRQSAQERYSAPENYLEVDVTDAQLQGVQRDKFVDYLVTVRTNLPLFKLEFSQVLIK
jgi:sorting nexin-3/12